MNELGEVSGTLGKESNSKKTTKGRKMLRSQKQGRTTAKRMLTLSIKALDEAIYNNQSNSVVESMFQNVIQYWSKVQVEHAEYLECILDDEEEIPDDEVKWLLDCSMQYANAGTAKDHYKSRESKVPAVKEEVKLKKDQSISRSQR